MKFDLEKFQSITGKTRKDIALSLKIDVSNLSRVHAGKRELTVPQILKLQQLDEKAWEQCIEKDMLDKLQGANMDIEL